MVSAYWRDVVLKECNRGMEAQSDSIKLYNAGKQALRLCVGERRVVYERT